MGSPASTDDAGLSASDEIGSERVHPRAALVIRRYLSAVDVAVPGLVKGLHLVGSAVLDDFRPDVSDVYFVAEIAQDPTADVSGELGQAHRRLA